MVEARRRHAVLCVVHVRRRVPAGGRFQTPDPQPPHAVECADSRAKAVITASLKQAVGKPPADINVRKWVAVGTPGRALSRLAGNDDDLLVVGQPVAHWWSHRVRRAVGEYCVHHAQCGVLAVPSSRLTRRSGWSGRLHWRARRNPWHEFDETTRPRRQHIR